jgi:hypothetical protein
MADSQKSMVSVVAIIAIVVLVGLAIWFVRRESSDTLQIEIGEAVTPPVWVASAESHPPFPGFTLHA